MRGEPRVLIVGNAGQVGVELQRSFAGRGEVIGVDRESVDLAQPDQVRAWVRRVEPEIILNAAAYTAVDRAESETELAMAINAEAPRILAEEALRTNALLVHYSTDYVFDGAKQSPWTEQDTPAPLNAYGATKLAGEEAILQTGGRVLIFRTSWVYGPHGSNFLLTMLRLARQRDALSIVSDQIGSPTTSIELAHATQAIVSGVIAGQFGATEEWAGLYHMTCSGSTSWCGFAQAIFARSGKLLDGKVPLVTPIASEEYPTPAKRPHNSVLSNAKAGSPLWRSARAVGDCPRHGHPGLGIGPRKPQNFNSRTMNPRGDSLMKRVYMDANATTPLLPEVMEAMRPYWMERFGNASSIHLDGQQAHSAVDRARATLAELFNCHDAEVIFNSGGTEGDNTAIFGLLRPGDHFITTSIEHSAILAAAERAASRDVDTTFVAPQPSGLIDPAEIERALRPETRLISVMLANNETGVLQPVEEIGRIARQAGAFFHIDGVQGAGKVQLDVRRFGCHLLSISAHKMNGPKGVGAMFVRRGTPIEPLLVGGSHERRRRAGTENVPGIVGLAKAAELAMLSLEDGTMDRLAGLRDRLEAGILQLAGTGVNGSYLRQTVGAPSLPRLCFCGKGGIPRTSTGHVHDDECNPVPRVANTTNIWFDQLEGEALVIALDLKGVAVSGGSACHSGATEPSHVLMAMGLNKTQARASLRFSLLKTATEADVDYVLKMVPEAVEHLRAISPVAAGTLG